MFLCCDFRRFACQEGSRRVLLSLRVVKEGNRACRGGPWPEGADGRPYRGQHASMRHLGGQMAGKCHRFQCGRVSIIITSKITTYLPQSWKCLEKKYEKCRLTLVDFIYPLNHKLVSGLYNTAPTGTCLTFSICQNWCIMGIVVRTVLPPDMSVCRLQIIQNVVQSCCAALDFCGY